MNGRPANSGAGSWVVGIFLHPVEVAGTEQVPGGLVIDGGPGKLPREQLLPRRRDALFVEACPAGLASAPSAPAASLRAASENSTLSDAAPEAV